MINYNNNLNRIENKFRIRKLNESSNTILLFSKFNQ